MLWVKIADIWTRSKREGIERKWPTILGPSTMASYLYLQHPDAIEASLRLLALFLATRLAGGGWLSTTGLSFVFCPWSWETGQKLDCYVYACTLNCNNCSDGSVIYFFQGSAKNLAAWKCCSSTYAFFESVELYMEFEIGSAIKEKEIEKWPRELSSLEMSEMLL